MKVLFSEENTFRKARQPSTHSGMMSIRGGMQTHLQKLVGNRQAAIRFDKANLCFPRRLPRYSDSNGAPERTNIQLRIWLLGYGNLAGCLHLL